MKSGNLKSLQDLFKRQKNLEHRLNLLCGFEDCVEYGRVLESTVYSPVDETMQFILSDHSTVDWNPLIYAVFYQQFQIMKFFCEGNAYVRSCMTSPFTLDTNTYYILDEQESADGEEGQSEKFVIEKSEIFALVLCIMLANRDIFKYLLDKCSYIWNEVHIILLINYIFEA